MTASSEADTLRIMDLKVAYVSVQPHVRQTPRDLLVKGNKGFAPIILPWTYVTGSSDHRTA